MAGGKRKLSLPFIKLNRLTHGLILDRRFAAFGSAQLVRIVLKKKVFNDYFFLSLQTIRKVKFDDESKQITLSVFYNKSEY